MALGLGLSLLVIGVFGGAVLPCAGGWLTMVKAGFGKAEVCLMCFPKEREEREEQYGSSKYGHLWSDAAMEPGALSTGLRSSQGRRNS
ncbi:cytochrome c biogenesis protein CcdA [Crenobacter oryzisoli]|uniref:cytochrome c biogenesis protein CcdA n=1 Tax=Crenobacter oryzisoli TaxID=3056844 RepID=UPI003F494989